MFQDRCYERDNEMTNQFVGDNNTIEMNMDVDNNMNMGMMGNMPERPMMGPVQERVVNRTFVHEVP
ncbi:MAG: hypothetical protein RSB99_04805, partial [Bacilli bacterium]